MPRIRTLSAFACLLLFVGVGVAPAAAADPTDAKTETAAGEAAEAAAEPTPKAVPLRDGRLFDPGVTMDAPAEGAPAELAKLVPFLGDWDVEMDVTRPGQDGPTVLSSTGRAKITFMNRGHAVLERLRFADFDGDGHPMAAHSFWVVDGNGVWAFAEANSWAQAITVFSGGLDDKGRWVLHQAMRPGGGPGLLLLRRTVTPGDAAESGAIDRFTVTVERSNDLGETWNPAVERRFTRSQAADVFPVREDYGEPAPERVAEAGQFDFLIGEYTATNWLSQPTGERRWTSNATAVHVLDGKGILEFGWVNGDPTLPDAATSILRLYNQSMRRWESLYLTNRSQRVLYFGGVQEGDRIVLHPFAAQTAANPMFQWIFFDVKEDTYRWKGLQSNDRGASWNPTWTIDFVRKRPPSEG